MKQTKRALQAEATKKKILDVGIQLINEYGYDNVTIDDIVERAGVSKGTFYHHFRHKDYLIDANSQLHSGEFETQLAGMTDATLEEKLTFFITQWFQYVDKGDLTYARRWYSRALETSGAAGDSAALRKYEADSQTISGLLTEAIADGVLRQDTPVMPIAGDITFSMYGAGLYRCMTNSRFQFAQWSKIFCDYVFQTILKQYYV